MILHIGDGATTATLVPGDSQWLLPPAAALWSCKTCATVACFFKGDESVSWEETGLVRVRDRVRVRVRVRVKG